MHRFTRAVRAVRDRIRRTIRRVTDWWQEHRDRVTEQHGYADMLTDLFLTAAELLVDNLRVRYLIRAFAHAYVWVIRAFGPHPDPGWI
jgi:hypothetical protein